MASLSSSEQRARDALSFEPLPVARWLSMDDRGLIVRVNYSERLSSKIRNLPGARWDAADRSWRLPFSASEALRSQFGEIEALASQAREAREAETKVRDNERKQREQVRAAEASRKAQERLQQRPRPMKPEHLLAADAPRVTVTLEAIGDDIASHPFGGFPKRNWVAQVVGLSANGRWSLCYVNGTKDYSQANSKGSRGIRETYILDQGLIYMVASPESWKRTRRYFCKATADGVIEMTEDEARSCLAN